MVSLLEAVAGYLNFDALLSAAWAVWNSRIVGTLEVAGGWCFSWLLKTLFVRQMRMLQKGTLQYKQYLSKALDVSIELVFQTTRARALPARRHQHRWHAPVNELLFGLQ